MVSQRDSDICDTFNKHSGTTSLENSQADTDALEAYFHFNGHKGKIYVHSSFYS